MTWAMGNAKYKKKKFHFYVYRLNNMYLLKLIVYGDYVDSIIKLIIIIDSEIFKSHI